MIKTSQPCDLNFSISDLRMDPTSPPITCQAPPSPTPQNIRRVHNNSVFCSYKKSKIETWLLCLNFIFFHFHYSLPQFHKTHTFSPPPFSSPLFQFFNFFRRCRIESSPILPSPPPLILHLRRPNPIFTTPPPALLTALSRTPAAAVPAAAGAFAAAAASGQS